MSRNKLIRILTAVVVICALTVFGYSMYTVFGMANEYRTGDKSYEDIAKAALSSGDTDIPSTLSPEDQSLTAKLPPDYLPVDFDELKKINKDIYAWLRCDGTLINYPVLYSQTQDYYLYRLPDKRKNANGSIFLDTRNTPEFTDKNSILYGHHMNTGKMFGTLVKYKMQTYYLQYPIMYLETEQQIYEVRLFAGFETGVDGDVYNISFADDEAYGQWLMDAVHKSTFQSDYLPDKAYRTLTLSTCDYEFDNARYVVLGQLIPASK